MRHGGAWRPDRVFLCSQPLAAAAAVGLQSHPQAQAQPAADAKHSDNGGAAAAAAATVVTPALSQADNAQHDGAPRSQPQSQQKQQQQQRLLTPHSITLLGTEPFGVVPELPPA